MRERIAIVGIGLRFPGGTETLDTPAGFDEFLRAGRSGIRTVPPDRWDIGAFSANGTGPAPGKIFTERGGFLDNIDEFDAQFFNISPKQAPYIDPQQRMLLETAWEALENANIDPATLRHGNGGVYIGASSVDYAMELDTLPYEELDGALATGVTTFPLSGRLSYFLGWRGPSLSMDTACSSSLTALHVAAQGLRDGECDIALCGAVNTMHHPRVWVMFSHGQMLAQDGRCKAFDEAADGYARAEGCGVLVLKRLSDAQRDGDTILAVVRGTAIGQDGESAGLTAPNGTAQEEIMRAALAEAELEPGDIQYVEAHGTGTPLGDPIEMGSIHGVYGSAHSRDNRLTVGSLKSNLGHMEPAAGIGGIVKTVLQLRSGTFYPHLYETPSGRIPWDDYPVTLPTECRPWDGPVRRAMVNSFGLAGGIGIAVLEQAPAPVPDTGASRAEDDAAGHVFTLSAKSQPALGLQIERYRRHLAEHPDLRIADLCYTRNLGRSHFKHRMAGVVRDAGELDKLLDRQAAAIARNERTGGGYRKSAFLFAGSGSQYVGMGHPLYRQFPLFRRHVDECDELFARHLGRSIADIMFGRAPDAAKVLDETVYTHAALFTLEYSLARLWLSWGIRPNVLIGHSVGEVIAATVAGLFTLPDGIAFLTARARLIESAPGPGGMAAVAAYAAEVEPLLADRPDVAIAAVNSPQQCVVSGAADSVTEVAGTLRARGLTVTPLQVSAAFHSPLLAGVADRLGEVFAGIRFHEPTMTIVSNLTGEPAAPREMATAEYWIRHLREPVDFEGGMRTVGRRGKHVIVEIGPSTALTSLARQCLAGTNHKWLSSLHKRDDTGTMMRRAVADAYTAGLSVSWAGVHAGGPGRKVTLPGYAFDRQPYWLPNRSERHGVAGRSGADAGRLTVRETTGDTADAARAEQGVREFAVRLSAGRPGYLADHTVGGRVFVPAAAYLEMVLAVADALYGETRRPIEDVRFHEALFLTDQPEEVRIRTRDAGGRVELEIAGRAPGRDDAAGRRYVTANLGPAGGHAGSLSAAGADLGRRFAATGEPDRTLTADEVYAAYAAAGLDYGPQFRRAETVGQYGPDLAVTELDGRDVSAAEHMPPPVLDGATHGLAALAADGDNYVAVQMNSVRVLRKPRARHLRAALRTTPAESDELAFTADVLLLDGDDPIAEIAGMGFRRLPRPAAAPRSGGRAGGRSPGQTAAGSRGRSRGAEPGGHRPGAPRLDPVELRSRTRPERVAAIEELVRITVAELLRIDDVSRVDATATFLELGLDSLVAVDLKAALESALGLRLAAATVVFDHPSAELLAEFLDRQLDSAEPTEPSAESATVTPG
jgi:acyl transferase domain-containing protein